MKAFWWFKEDAIAGMARPGFNAVRWFDLPFDEAILLGWVGRYSCERETLESLREHLRVYAPKVFRFYGLDEVSGAQVIETLHTEAGLATVLRRLGERTQTLADFELRDDHIHFEWHKDRFQEEVAFLQSQGIDRIVTLTELHHQKEELARHFDVHHISIEDLGAPTLEQVHQLAQIIETATQGGEKLAAHCLAGIGRTSTMLMAAHVVRGHTVDEVVELIRRQNPVFVLTGPQGEFIRSLKS